MQAFLRGSLFAALAAALCGCGGGHSGSIIAGYRAVILPLPAGFTDSNAFGISDNGDVLGSVSVSPTPITTVERACVWRHRQPTLLPSPGSSAEATRTDGQGNIIGSAQVAADVRHAALWRNGVYTDLGTLPGGSDSEAVGLSSGGLIAGNAFGSDGATHPVLWQNGAITDITVPGLKNMRLVAMNARGHATGTYWIYSYTGNSRWKGRAFLYADGHVTDLPGQPLGDADFYVHAMNDSDEVVGEGQGTAIDQDGTGLGCIWSGGTLRYAGAPPGYTFGSLLDVTNRGDVLGDWLPYRGGGGGGIAAAARSSTARTRDYFPPHIPVLYHGSQTLVLDGRRLLLQPGWSVANTVGINALDEICVNLSSARSGRAAILLPE